MTAVRYLTREEWGGVWKGTPPAEVLGDPEMYVHHVGGQAWMSDDAVKVFRDLNAYAQNVKGYQFLDYDVLVHYSRPADLVTIGEGRGIHRSAATLDRNELGEAVCACGNYQLREPLAEEIEGIALAIVWTMKKGWLAPDAKILGHKDNPAHPNATTCPGQYLYPKLQTIRDRVAAILAPPPTSGGTYVVQPGDSWWGISRKYGISVNELLALNPPATSSTVIHPGDVLIVPGLPTPPTPEPTPPPSDPKAPNGLTAAENVAAGTIASTPPSNPVIKNTLVHVNSPWLQQVLCAIPKLSADGGGPIYPPEWVGEGRLGSGPAVFQLFGDGGKAALAYWQSKNGLTADGVYGPQTEQRLRAVRGR